MNGYECVQFERKGRIGIDQPAQPVVVQRPPAIVPRNGNVMVKGASAAPHKNGKATNSIPDQTKPKKKVFQ